MITLEIAKQHLRIMPDDTFDDAIIQAYIDAAVEYVGDLTEIPNDAAAPKTYDLVVMLLVAHYYQNREAASEGNSKKIPYGVDALLTNLRPAGGLI